MGRFFIPIKSKIQFINKVLYLDSIEMSPEGKTFKDMKF